MYQEMLEMVDPSNIQQVLRMQDDMGNTPLHEVAFAGLAEMVASILKYEVKETEYEPLLYVRNILGETPVYRAAALGNTNLLKYFVEDLERELRQHFHRTVDNMSILHTAVIGQNFGLSLFQSYSSILILSFVIRVHALIPLLSLAIVNIIIFLSFFWHCCWNLTRQ